MDVICNKDNSTVTITIDEPLNAKHLSDLQEKVKEVHLGFGSHLILDCSGMDYICSSGLREFLGMAKQAKEVGADMKIKGLQPLVKNVFDMTGFTQLFTFED